MRLPLSPLEDSDDEDAFAVSVDNPVLSFKACCIPGNGKKTHLTAVGKLGCI